MKTITLSRRQVLRGAGGFTLGLPVLTSLLPKAFAADYPGNWHDNVAHMHTQPEPQKLLVRQHQEIFADAFVDLASRLDVEEAPGSTFLDNTLLVWSQEAGMWTHDTDSMPVVTAGSAGGFLKTGMFVDYRNRTPSYRLGSNAERFTGKLYNQWLATALHAMGIPRSEWDLGHDRGYGAFHVRDQYLAAGKPKYVEAALQDASNPLPIIT